MSKWVIFFVFVMPVSIATFAAHTEPILDLPPADLEAGKQKSKACAACHGVDGNSTNPMYPSLAGQVPGYIADQLDLFQTGGRKNDIMAGMVAGLSKQDLADLDAYYVSLELKPSAIPKEERDLAKRGERLYRGGYAPLNVAACIGCHGPNGRGIPIHFPRVAGQQREYMENQLKAFKDSYQHPESGVRISYGDIMTSIAFLLSDQQIKEVTAYMHALK